jgi:hypothetical protein
MKPWAVAFVAGLALFAPLALADDEAAPVIVIGGDDAELIEAVTAELRAAGFEVIAVGDDAPSGTKVVLERRGEAVVLHTTRPDGKLEAELVAPEGEAGMSRREVTAIQTAEAIRSLVAARRKAEEQAPAAPAAPAPPEAPLPPPAPVPLAPVSLAPAPPPPPMPMWYPSADVLQPAAERVVLRLGMVGGGGFVPPIASLAVGATLRGQLNSHLHMGGLLLAMPQIGEGEVEQYNMSTFAARGALMIGWDMLGAENFWTPSLGGGLSVEYRGWEMTPSPYSPLASEPQGNQSTIFYETQGGAIGVGLTATIGVSISRPWRGRFDILTDLRVNTFALDGSHADLAMPRFSPSVLAVVGFEYDLVREWSATPAATARR